MHGLDHLRQTVNNHLHSAIKSVSQDTSSLRPNITTSLANSARQPTHHRSSVTMPYYPPQPPRPLIFSILSRIEYPARPICSSHCVINANQHHNHNHPLPTCSLLAALSHLVAVWVALVVASTPPTATSPAHSIYTKAPLSATAVTTETRGAQSHLTEAQQASDCILSSRRAYHDTTHKDKFKRDSEL